MDLTPTYSDHMAGEIEMPARPIGNADGRAQQLETALICEGLMAAFERQVQLARALGFMVRIEAVKSTSGEYSTNCEVWETRERWEARLAAEAAARSQEGDGDARG